MLLSEELMKDLSKRVVEEGEGYQRARVAFNILLAQYGDGAYLASKYVGGEHAHRDHRGDPKGRDPLMPVAAAKQREALQFLQKHILDDKPFQFPPDLLRRLAVGRWYHWGSRFGSTDFPLYDRVLAIQELALDQLLDPSVLRRIQNNALKAAKGEKPLTVAEVFRGITDAVWSDLSNGAVNGERPVLATSIIRRNLQRAYLKRLSNLVLGPKPSNNDWFFMLFFEQDTNAPPDARSLARAHLREIGRRIGGALNDRPAGVDETTQAHLEECRERIDKVLKAAMQVND
jgi:hypothetical protein